MKTKILILFSLFSFFGFSAYATGQLDITVSFEKQGGWFSNQYAVWIEDGDGNLVKTLFVTKFTAEGGYKKRSNSVPVWVSKANPSAMTKVEVDAFSGATPKTGDHTYTWDLTNKNGKKVNAGTYTYVVEGTLYGKKEVLYKGKVDISGKESVSSPQAQYTSDSSKNRDMIKGVNAKFIP